jgi:hypothetical protein
VCGFSIACLSAVKPYEEADSGIMGVINLIILPLIHISLSPDAEQTTAHATMLES